MDKYVCTNLVCIDGCSKCQLNCPECPTKCRKAPLNEGKGYLTFSDFKYLLDENPHIKEAFIDCRGELFLNPDLYEIRKAREMAYGLDMEFQTKMQWNSDFSPIKDKELVLEETGWNTTNLYGIGALVIYIERQEGT